MHQVKLLDCTLRDGGYYNSWDFERPFVKKYIEAMEALPADAVEIGFRTSRESSGKFLGAYAYSTEEHIKTLGIPKSLELSVMVNASDILNSNNRIETSLDSLFLNANNSVISMVRIATHIADAIKCFKIFEFLKNKGYKTALNIMQISELERDHYVRLLREVKTMPADVLYLVDSLGNMKEESVKERVEIAKGIWPNEIGFHAHNNMDRALSTSLSAVQEGADWIDGTVLGMGRGAGNAKTEYLALEMEPNLRAKVNILPLLKLVNGEAESLRKKYSWGPNPYYYVAAKNSIHPTYIQQMQNNLNLSEEDIIGGIENLKKENSSKFEEKKLFSSKLVYFSSKGMGSWSPKSVLSGRDVLLLGSGPGVLRYKEAIEALICRIKPVVIALNLKSSINESLVDYRAMCHPVRLASDLKNINTTNKPLIIPYSMLSSATKQNIGKHNVLDYGLELNRDLFIYYDTYSVIPNLLAISYAFAVASSGIAQRILLAGFDGYDADDPRTSELNNTLMLYTGNSSSVPLISVTPTKFKLPQGSVYNPNI